MTAPPLSPSTHALDAQLSALDAQHQLAPLDLCARLETLLTIVREQGDIAYTARILSLLAWARARANQYEPALLLGYEALLLSREHGLLAVEVHTIGAIAFVFRVWGLKRESAALFRYALEQYEEHQAMFNQIDGGIRCGLAVNADAMSRFDLGERQGIPEALHRALSLIPVEAKSGLHHAMILNNLATVRGNMGALDTAFQYAQRALTLAQRADSASVIVQIEYNQAWLHLHNGSASMALEHLHRARALLPRGEINLNTIQIAIHEGRVLDALNQPEPAVIAWERAYRLSVESSNLHLASQSLDELREFYERRGDYAAANRIFHRMAEDVVRRRDQGSELRLKALALVFAHDKATVHGEVPMTAQRHALLERLSHEFRTPLTIIQSSAETLNAYAERMPVEQRRKHLQNINTQVGSLTDMIRNVEAFLDDDDDTLIKPSVSLDDSISKALTRLTGAGMPIMRIHVNVAPDGIGDVAPALETIFFHLLHNALRYSSETVYLDVRADADALVLRVTDTGIGIPRSEQPRIFQPLTYASNRRVATGGGIGLALVARYVSQMQGTIEIASAENQGTKLTVRVPL